MHAETAAFRAAGRRALRRLRHGHDPLAVLVLQRPFLRQFGIGTVVIGEAQNFEGGHSWVAEHGCKVVLVDDAECIALLGDFIAANPEVWHEDIGL